MGSGGVAIAALPTVICLKVPFSDGLGGGSGQMVNVTDGCCAATITTRYEAIGPTNILTLAHYPMTVVLYEFE